MDNTKDLKLNENISLSSIFYLLTIKNSIDEFTLRNLLKYREEDEEIKNIEILRAKINNFLDSMIFEEKEKNEKLIE